MNYFEDCPREIVSYIFSFVIDADIKKCTRNLSQIYNWYIHTNIKNHLKNLKALKIIELTEKYNKYDDPNSTLYDAVLTSCILPFAKHSQKIFTTDVENDIYDIINLIPNTINYNKGVLRCRDNVSVLCAACHNPWVSTDIIKYLVEKGAYTNHKVLVNGVCMDILDDIKRNCIYYEFDYEKYDDLVKIFNNTDYKNL